MGVIRTNAAAAMLGVSPNTLRSWERRFGFPEPRAHRRRPPAVRPRPRSRRCAPAFEETHNVSSAISIARERGAGPASPARLRSAFGRFDEDEADRLLEESLAVRSVERTVEEVLLPAVEALRARTPAQPPTPEYGFAWRWATGWLAAAQRVAPPATRAEGVLIFDASARLRHRRAARPGARARACAARGLRTLTLDRRTRPQPPGARAARAGPARGRAHRPRRVARRARPPRLRRAPRRRRATSRSSTSAARCPTRGAQHRRRARPTTPLAARDAIVARLDGRARRGAARAEAAAHLRAVAS